MKLYILVCINEQRKVVSCKGYTIKSDAESECLEQFENEYNDLCETYGEEYVRKDYRDNEWEVCTDGGEHSYIWSINEIDC